MQNALMTPNHAGAGAHHYMHIMGIVALGSMWVRMGQTALDALAAGTTDTAFYQAKLTTARYFAERFCPDTASLRRKIEAGADAVMALPIADFATA
jgi:hypothetical protein